jgi:hypothetical protein
MNIQTPQSFHAIIQVFQAILSAHNVPIKTKKLETLFARTVGFNSANALYAAIPCGLELTSVRKTDGLKLLRQQFPHSRELEGNPLEELDMHFCSYASTYPTPFPVPHVVPSNDKYWYLTSEGWVLADRIPRTKVMLGINVFQVVLCTQGDGFLWFGSSQTVWDSSLSSLSSEKIMLRLRQEYGDWPAQTL